MWVTQMNHLPMPIEHDRHSNWPSMQVRPIYLTTVVNNRDFYDWAFLSSTRIHNEECATSIKLCCQPNLQACPYYRSSLWSAKYSFSSVVITRSPYDNEHPSLGIACIYIYILVACFFSTFILFCHVEQFFFPVFHDHTTENLLITFMYCAYCIVYNCYSCSCLEHATQSPHGLLTGSPDI